MKDEANLTFSHTVESVSSPEAMEFQREKFTPRIDRLAKALEKPLADAVVLDIGIGYGSVLQIMEHDYGVSQLFGMDPFPKSLELARQNTGADLRMGDIDDSEWPFESGEFDAIACFDVIEHLVVPATFFVRARRYLRDGGLLLATTPNKLLPYHMRKLPLVGIPDRNPTHINVRVPEYWRRLATATGYTIVEEWMGEHLSHVRHVPRLLGAALEKLGFDPREVPGLNHFQQSFCLLLRKR